MDSAVIVISRPELLTNEAEVLKSLFAAGLSIYHLRKPDASRNEIAELIAELPQRYHDRIVLHAHHELSDKFAVRGLHIRSTWQNGQVSDTAIDAMANPGVLTISAACHDLAYLNGSDESGGTCADCDYVFYSPVFNSISKPGYRPTASWENIVAAVQKSVLPVFALGGVTVDNISRLRVAGFAGAAVLGAVWQATDPVASWRKMDKQWRTTNQ